MSSVTQRIKQIKQPRGGYLKPQDFSANIKKDGIDLYESENISPIIVGLAVDYLSRYLCNTPKEEAFRVSLRGAKIDGSLEKALSLLDKIYGLDDESIASACNLCQYDVYARSGLIDYRLDTIFPDDNTIFNIRTMINRNIDFFNRIGNITMSGFTFMGGYTDVITSGDGDFLTEDTLWDIKVSKKGPTNKHTLQLLIYYLMGYQSVHKEFTSIEYLGIYNPRLNAVYKRKISDINYEVIKQVAYEVIGYKENDIGHLAEFKKKEKEQQKQLKEVLKEYSLTEWLKEKT